MANLTRIANSNYILLLLIFSLFYIFAHLAISITITLILLAAIVILYYKEKISPENFSFILEMITLPPLLAALIMLTW